MAPDLILCLIAAVDSRPEAYGEANGQGITIVGGFHVFNHLRSAIQLGETIAWGKGSRGQLLMLGRRGNQEPLPLGLPALKANQSLKKKRQELPEAVKEPFPANTITIKQLLEDLMKPYPARPTIPSEPTTKTITMVRWDSRNAHWLDTLMDPENTKDESGPIVEQEVTEIFPLVSKARCNILNRWAKSEDFNLNWDLLKAPILSEVEVTDEVSPGPFQAETTSPLRYSLGPGLMTILMTILMMTFMMIMMIL